MNKKLKKVLFLVKYTFKTRLPIGRTEMNDYLDELFLYSGIPNLPSYRQAVATMVLHLSPTEDKKSRRFFIKAIKKAMANETSYSLIQELKEEEKKKQQKLTSEAALKDKVGEADPLKEQPLEQPL